LPYLGYASAHANVSSLSYTFLGGWAKNPYLGKLCPRRHDYNGTGQSLLRKTNHLCLACDRERAQERRQAKQQGTHA
jgi:hypothetical protein